MESLSRHAGTRHGFWFRGLAKAEETERTECWTCRKDACWTADPHYPPLQRRRREGAAVEVSRSRDLDGCALNGTKSSFEERRT